MRRFLPALVVSLCVATPAFAIVPTIEKPIAVLRALDKVTARVEELNVPVNSPLTFGTLTINVRTCRVTPPEEQPEAAAFIEVSEIKIGENDVPVFHGWMFASSPALSALEHPVYDIWVTGCKDIPQKDAPKVDTGPIVPAEVPLGTQNPVGTPVSTVMPAGTQAPLSKKVKKPATPAQPVFPPAAIAPGSP